jgi:hypothetical protein
MTQWWFRACVLMFLLTLLQCQENLRQRALALEGVRVLGAS